MSSETTVWAPGRAPLPHRTYQGRGRPPSLFVGYYKNDAETAASRRGEWYLTGDRAQVDDDGYFWFVGRADDDEVVVHDQQPLGAIALLHPLHLAGWRMDQYNVCFATRAESQRRPRSNADRLHLVTRLLLEQRDEHIQ